MHQSLRDKLSEIGRNYGLNVGDDSHVLEKVLVVSLLFESTRDYNFILCVMAYCILKIFYKFNAWFLFVRVFEVPYLFFLLSLCYVIATVLYYSSC